VRLDGSLRAMEDESMWDLDSGAGHTSMGERQPVIMAGTVEVGESGEITMFDNFSGHYRPSQKPDYDSPEAIAGTAFRNFGLPVPAPGTWTLRFASDNSQDQGSW
jgi:hypothetical protein